MKIEQIRIKNFKAFKDMEMRDIPNFCVIVGANGTGKSTLFQVFSFLKEAMLSNVNTALTKLGAAAALARCAAAGQTAMLRLKSNSELSRRKKRARGLKTRWRLIF